MSMYSARSQLISAVGRPTWNRWGCQICSQTTGAWEHTEATGAAAGNSNVGLLPNFWQGQSREEEQAQEDWAVGWSRHPAFMADERPCAELTTGHPDTIPFPGAPQALVTIPASGSRCQALACRGREEHQVQDHTQPSTANIRAHLE